MKSGDILGRYEVISLLARGGMAEVWRARIKGESGFRKELVLKSILPHLAEDPEFESMFINEALLAARLNHPNVVQIFDLGKVDDQFFIVMEHVPGFSLRQIARALRKRKRAMPPWFLLRAIVDVCEGLQYAHDLTDNEGRELHIVHRDISPENIMVSQAGLVKVLDFGVAKAATGAGSTKAGTLKGKYAYIPPELIQGEEADRRTDVYAIGVMLYELLCGKRPYHGDNELQLLKNVLAAKPRPPSQIYKWIPADLERIILRAMHPKRDMRYYTTQQLGDALRLFISQRLHDQHNQRHMGQLVKVLFDSENETKQKSKSADVEIQLTDPDPRASVSQLSIPHLSDQENVESPSKSGDEDSDIEVDDFDIVDLGSGDILLDEPNANDEAKLSLEAKAEKQISEAETQIVNSSDIKPKKEDAGNLDFNLNDGDGQDLGSGLLDFATEDEDVVSPPTGTLAFLQSSGKTSETSTEKAHKDISPLSKKTLKSEKKPNKNIEIEIPNPNVDSIARSPVEETSAKGKTPPKWLQTTNGSGKIQETPEKTPSWLNTTTRAEITEQKGPSWLSTSDKNQAPEHEEKKPNWLATSRELRSQVNDNQPAGWPFATNKTGENATEAGSELKLPKKDQDPDSNHDEAAIGPKVEAERLFAKGLEYMREKNEAAAIAQWEQAIELDPDNRRYAFNLKRIKEK